MEIGLMLWAFILIGNAVALVALSAITSSGSSAMGAGDSHLIRRDPA